MVLVGPSGCGKSTLLRLIAGLEDVEAGSISIGDRDVTDLPPRQRDIAMVFQSYALYPHMTVRQNLGYGLKVRRLGKQETEERVERVARLLRLDELLERRPAALSGGQRQRVAMGRAIVREPQAFLMDEPLSNLDAKLRVGMRAELASLHGRLGATTVYVTHDQVEAMTLGQRVAVMRNGRIQQVDTPKQLYARPINLFVASFIGSPAMNLVEATLDDERGRVRWPPDRAAAGAPARCTTGADHPRDPPRVVRGRELRRPLAAAAGRRRGRARGARLGRTRPLPRGRDAGRDRGAAAGARGRDPDRRLRRRLHGARRPCDGRPTRCAPAARGRPGRVPLLRRRHRREPAPRPAAHPPPMLSRRRSR